jgi:hypothetical protein
MAAARRVTTPRSCASDSLLGRDYRPIPYSKVMRPIRPLDEQTTPCLIA